MPRPPQISVIMPVFNGEKYISAAIESVLNQTFQDIELIIVNDGSTDKTGDTILLHSEKDPRVITITSENRGVSAARNAALRVASGKYVSVIDADDLWVAEKLDQQISELLKDDSRIIIAGIKRFILDEHQQIVWGRESILSPNTLSVGDYHKFVLGLSHSQMSIFHTLCARRDFLVASGGWDESLKSAEDWDFWLRLSLVHNFHHIEMPLVLYRKHTESQTYISGYKTPLDSQMRIIENLYKRKVIDRPAMKHYKGGRYLEIIKSQLYWRRPFNALKLCVAAAFKTDIVGRAEYYRILSEVIKELIVSALRKRAI